MTTWALIPCSKRKAGHACPAGEMYWPSALFRGAWRVAEVAGQTPLILSAKYGVLRPHHEIDPYDLTLRAACALVRRNWAAGVLGTFSWMLTPGDRPVSYLGRDYAEFLLPALRERGFVVDEPLKGMSQGRRLQWFKEQLGGARL